MEAYTLLKSWIEKLQRFIFYLLKQGTGLLQVKQGNILLYVIKVLFAVINIRYIE